MAALSVEEIRAAFKSRYHAFKLLLAANNTALQLMTDMEAALHGSHSFGMAFIRSHATAVCVKVFTMIKYLNELSGNRYQALEAVFATIEREINAILTRRQAPPSRNWCCPWIESRPAWPTEWAARWPTWERSPRGCRS